MSNWETITKTSKLPESPGVYVFYFSEGSNVIPMYVGSTINLKSRICSGHKPRRNGTTRQWFLSSLSTCAFDFFIKIKRTKVYGDWAMDELRLIDRIGPKYNQLGKSRRYVRVRKRFEEMVNSNFNQGK